MKPLLQVVLATFLLCISIASAPLRSQTPTGQRPSFEVATIKSVLPPATTFIEPVEGLHTLARGQSLKTLINFAYRVRDYQVSGGPEWLGVDLWEIQVKVPKGSLRPQPKVKLVQPDAFALLTQPDTYAQMLQSLLEDRFRLQIHRETRELPIYEIVIADGGPKVRFSDEQDVVVPTAGGSSPIMMIPSDAWPVLALGETRVTGGSNGRMFEARAMPLWFLAHALRNVMGRTVTDKTGLKGLYDWKLEWTPDADGGIVQTSLPGGTAATLDAGEPSRPSIFTAIQEQLGLRLVFSKGPVEVLVIDSVQKPTLN